MIDQTFVGTWLLTGTHALNSEIPLEGNETKPGGVEEWLLGNSDDLIAQVSPAEGLTLTIRPDGTFSEEKTGDPQITWFDSEGVLESRIVPFGGTIQPIESRGYLTLEPGEISSYSLPDDPENQARIRYDDGDTKICDNVTVIDGSLLRTMSVVTDELYLDRVLLRYEKSGA